MLEFVQIGELEGRALFKLKGSKDSKEPKEPEESNSSKQGLQELSFDRKEDSNA